MVRSPRGTARTAARVARSTKLTLEGEKQAILDLKDRGEDEHWQIGRHYNNIVDGKLAEKAGFGHAREFFARELKEIPQSTLSLYGAVAHSFSEAQARKYGA